jgi:predicted transcriptional regulator
MTIRLSDDRLAALEERAAASGRSRSELVREAVDSFLATGEPGAVDAAILAGYARIPASAQDEWALAGTLALLGGEPW